jgi:hypothetical protein
MKKWLAFLVLWLAAVGASAQAFDHGYAAWDGLLKQHVRWLPDGKQSRVDYAGFQRDRATLTSVLAAMSAVTPAEFKAFGREQQMAFLINAYNAFTVELILTKYPDLKSIKDLGSLFRSPWKIEFFTLLGDKRHLDWIEHEQLRPVYKEPRVHAAVNCASIGCPALRDEAFTAARLEAQLEDGMRRFMADRTRNRVAGGEVQVSSIFKWFREDFESGAGGFRRLADVFAKYASQLSDQPEEQARLRERALPVAFLDYDWSLNALGR